MILAQAPLRISFVGGGTDLASFYTQYPGRVISTAIDKYAYVLLNPTPLIDEYTIKYSKTEIIDAVEKIEHTRIRAALTDLHLTKGGIEIGSFADLPSRTGLGSSSSFSVALLNCLHAYVKEKESPRDLAEAASRLEIELLGEPIGKQDQYAAAFGGLHIYQFNPDGSVDVQPVSLSTSVQKDIESHAFLFYTGLTRDAGSVLSAQKANTHKKIDVLKKMADSVEDFAATMQKGDIKGMGDRLHEGWLLKKSLTSGITNQSIDTLYEVGLKAGAYGGKVLGAGGGGCLLFLIPPTKRQALHEALHTVAEELGLQGYREFPIKFEREGAKVLVNNLGKH